LKVYNTFGDIHRFNKIFREFKFVQETELIEYLSFYYNEGTEQVYIRQPLYSTSLAVQIKEDQNKFHDEQTVKIMALDILKNLWLVHNAGYIHGDIKPRNIVKREFNDNDQYIHDGWKLIDFSTMKKNKSKGPFVGTPGWCSPEMAMDSNKNKYLKSSDIFSFGLVILFALFGSQPLDISNEEKIKYGQCSNVASKTTDIPFEHKHENEKKEKQLKRYLRWKMYVNWYHEKLLKSEHMIKNYLIKLYFDRKISLNLFELLYGGMLVFNARKRWDCQKIYDSKWFKDIRDDRE